jgi:hypothetical protein
MRASLVLSVLGAAALCLATPAHADQDVLQQLQTKDLRMIWFHPAEDYLAPYATRCFENALNFHERFWGWTPDGKETVLLDDFGDYGDAATTSLPVNLMTVDIAPVPYEMETFVSNERICWFANHELTHAANLDQWTKADMRWRHLLGGKVNVDPEHPDTLLYRYLTDPRSVVPRWYLEGVAVFMETWMSGGRGRVQGAYDEMVFRAMVRDHAHFYDPAGLVAEGTKIDFQVGVNNYLYGTRFISWLALEYSPQKVIQWAARREGSDRYYAHQFKKVFGIPMTQAWNEWIAFEHRFQQANLARIEKYPVSKFQPLSKEGLGSTSRAYYDPQRKVIIGAFRYPGVAAFIGTMSVETGKITPLVDVKGPMLYKVTSLAYDPATRTAFYTTDNTGYRSVVSLNTVTGQTRVLLDKARIGDLAFDRADRSLWGIRHLNGIVTLVRIPYPYTTFHQVHSWPFGEIAYDLDVSPDGKLLSYSHVAIGGDQSLHVVPVAQILAGDTKPVASFNFGTAVPDGFVFAPDGQSLYGSSYYTGVSNIYRYDLASKQITALSNAETGFFRPVPMPDGRLLVFEYGGQGFVPGFIDPKPREDLAAIEFLGAEIAEKHPVVKTWDVGSPSKIDLKKVVTSRGDYKPLHEVRQHDLYPMVQGYKDSVAVGFHGDWGDPLGLERISLDAGYSVGTSLPDDERLHLGVRFDSKGYYVGYKHNGADFYDLFGPTKTSLRGNEWYVGMKRMLIFDEPRTLGMDLSLHSYNGLDTVPGAQNVNTLSSSLVIAAAQFNYSDTFNSLGAVDYEKGLRWGLNLQLGHAKGRTIPAINGHIDFGWPFLFKHSSLWLRNYAGWAHGDADDPYANYYFGAFGNNYIDHTDVKRYRQYYSFPGFKIDELYGRSYARSMLEWNLPPIRFSNIGTPANYLTWARTSLFVSALSINPGNRSMRQTATDVGIQIDFRFTVLHDQKMTFSIGSAVGFGPGNSGRTEWMASLALFE